MKKLAALLLCSGSVLANPTQQQQIDMMLTMMESSGTLTRLAQCLDLSKAKLTEALRNTYTACGLADMYSESANTVFEACLESKIPSFSGVPAARWQECGEQEDEQQDPVLAQLDALYERIGEREPTAAEQQQIEQLLEQMQQRGMAEMEMMVDGIIAGSQGSEHLITLPLYPQAQILVNIPAQAEIELGEQAYAMLPGASFVTTDSPQQVLQYYRQQLPDYKVHRSSLAQADEVALMQHLPAGFDYVKDMGRAFSIPHIYIQPASAAGQKRLPGAKTLFFIYYPPAS
ncbi:hypothetical protein [Rheinheimera gaetbuli]